MLRGRAEGNPSYENKLPANTAAFSANLDLYGSWAEEKYIADVASLTQTTPADWLEADTILENFITSSGNEHVRAICQILYSWLQRQMKLIEGLYAFPIGGMVPLDEILD